MEKDDIIIQMLTAIREDHGKRLDSIDNNLAEHMRRTALLENRVDSLETPGKAFKYLKSVLIYISIFTGVILSVLKLIDMCNK